MQKQSNIYRTQILFTGLTVDEMMNVETVFNRYSVFYKDSLSKVNKLENYDLICLTEEDYGMNAHLLSDTKIPYLIIGEESSSANKAFIKRSDFVRIWLEKIREMLPVAKRPVLEKIDVGSVVRSKTTPLFGKGVVIAFVSENEVMVKFPTTKLLSKDLAIRCHKSQLQNLGRLEDLAKR